MDEKLSQLSTEQLMNLMLESVDELLEIQNLQKLKAIDEKNDFIQRIYQVIVQKQFEKQLLQ